MRPLRHHAPEPGRRSPRPARPAQPERPAWSGRPPLRAVPDPASARREWLARLVTGLAVVAACFGLFGVIGVHVMLAQGQDAVQELEARLTQEQVRRQRLVLEEAGLEAPSRIVSEARDRLGLVPPTTVVPLRAASLEDPPPTTIAPAPATTPSPTAARR